MYLFKQIEEMQGWNLFSTNIMLLSYTIVKEIIVKLIMKRFSHGYMNMFILSADHSGVPDA